MKSPNEQNIDDILAVYKDLGINPNIFYKTFDPWELSKQYDDLIFNSNDCSYFTTSDTSQSQADL